MVDQVMKTFGRVDIVIANAGVTSLVPVAGMDEATWDDTLDTRRNVAK